MIFHQNCVDFLSAAPDCYFDSLVTDPPAGISFMGKAWDGDKGGREQWIAWMRDVMKECLRVMKPGAHGLVWAIPRTSHWTGMALEQAGFEVRDVVTHLFGTGFPKSLDISKAIDKAAGVERSVIAFDESKVRPNKENFALTAPATDAAKQWQGYGTALKPACEFWFLIRKPCSESTVAKNVLKWGVGGLNIDVSRIYSDNKRPDKVCECEKNQESLSANFAKKKTGHVGEAGSTNFAGINVVGQVSAGESTIHSDGLIQPDTSGLNIGMIQKKNTSTYSNIDLSTESQFPPDLLSTIKTKTNKTTESKICSLCLGQLISGNTQKGLNDPLKQELKFQPPVGRFPSNLVLDEEAAAALDEQSGVSKSAGKTGRGEGGKNGRYGPTGAQGIVECPSDTGGASRFFFIVRHAKQRECEITNAANAEQSLGIIQEIEKIAQTCFAQEVAAQILDLVNRFLSAKSAKEFAGFIETDFVLEAVRIKNRGAHHLDQCQGFTPDYKNFIPIRNLALIAGQAENTDTIQTIQNLSKLCGFALLATEESIRPENQKNDSVPTRFLYSAKASRADKNAGLEGMPKKSTCEHEERRGQNNSPIRPDGSSRKPALSQNHHPTVKSTKLMEYLIKLITPPNGIVLDPFMGSGSTGVAAERLGHEFVGIEMEKEYFEIARARLNNGILPARRR